MTFTRDTYYRSYRLSSLYSDNNDLVEVLILPMGVSEVVDRQPNLDEAKKVIDQWQNAR